MVGDEHDRVGAGLGGVAGQVEGEVAFAAAFDPLGGVDDLGRGFRGELDEFVADLDLGGGELADGRGIRVADGSVGVGDGLDDTVGALRSLAAVLLREVAVDLGVPVLLGGGLEVLGEVLRGARIIGTVNGGDLEIRQVGIRVVGLDGLVVPVGDVALEDLRHRLGREVELVDALDVEGHGDGGDVDGELVGSLGAAGFLSGLDLVIVEVGIGAGELCVAGEELLTAGARAVGGVVDGHTGVLRGEVRGPGIHGRLLRGGADAGQGALQVAAAAGGLFTGSGLAAASREGDGADREDRSGGGEMLHLHEDAFHVCGHSSRVLDCSCSTLKISREVQGVGT